MADDQSKTEKATPERRRKAREEGTFARGRDAGGIAAAFAVLLMLSSMSATIAEKVRVFAINCFRDPSELVHGNQVAVAERFLSLLGLIVVPSAAAAALAAIAIGFTEAGFNPQLSLVMPKWSRLNPIDKLKQMVSIKNALVEIILALLRLGLVGYVVYSTMSEAFPKLTRLAGSGLLDASHELATVVGHLTLRACFALAAICGVDYVYNHFKIEKQLMMSREEIKEEHKQQEGDPRVKARLRARARERTRRAISKQVKGADVILTNPTHVAVAIRYRVAEGAPVVLAKGYDEVALHIRDIAKEAGVRIVESPPLARALAKRVPVGKHVPVDLYAAIAEVLAFVYRLKGRSFA